MARKSASDLVVVQVAVDQVHSSQRNPRQRLRRIEELAESMRMHGLMQPIIVRPGPARTFELVAGHRRLAAARLLGWRAMDAVVRSATEDEAYVLTLVENLQRENLSAKEEARALEVLVRERRWTASEVASSIQRSVAYVSRRLRVFEDPILAPLVLQGQLTVSVAEELLPLRPERKQDLAQRAVVGQWDRKEVRAQIAERAAGVRTSRAGLQRMANQLRRALQGVWPGSLSDGERRELRLLFHDLTVLAKAPATTKQILPPLPAASTARRRRAR